MFTNFTKLFVCFENHQRLFNTTRQEYDSLFNSLYTILQEYNYIEADFKHNNNIDAVCDKPIVRIHMNGLGTFISYKKLYEQINYKLYKAGYLSVNNLYFIALFFMTNNYQTLAELYINRFKKLYNSGGTPLKTILDGYYELQNNEVRRYYSSENVHVSHKYSTYTLNGDNDTILLNHYMANKFNDECERNYMLASYYYYFKNDLDGSLKYFNALVTNYTENKQGHIPLCKNLYKYAYQTMIAVYQDIYNDIYYFDYSTKYNELMELPHVISTIKNYYRTL